MSGVKRDAFGRVQKGSSFSASKKDAATAASKTSSSQSDASSLSASTPAVATHIDPIRFAEVHARELNALESALQTASYLYFSSRKESGKSTDLHVRTERKGIHWLHNPCLDICDVEQVHIIQTDCLPACVPRQSVRMPPQSRRNRNGANRLIANVPSMPAAPHNQTSNGCRPIYGMQNGAICGSSGGTRLLHRRTKRRFDRRTVRRKMNAPHKTNRTNRHSVSHPPMRNCGEKSWIRRCLCLQKAHLCSCGSFSTCPMNHFHSGQFVPLKCTVQAMQAF